jgi:hypothetical protein
MTFEQFDKFQEELLKEVVGMKDTKGREYAHSKDRFANFNRLADGLGLPNTVIAWVYCKKHIDGIESYVKDNQTYSTEGVRGRIVDAIVYLTLIAGMIEEGQEGYMGYGYTCPNCKNDNHDKCINPDRCECKECDAKTPF